MPRRRIARSTVADMFGKADGIEEVESLGEYATFAERQNQVA